MGFSYHLLGAHSDFIRSDVAALAIVGLALSQVRHCWQTGACFFKFLARSEFDRGARTYDSGVSQRHLARRIWQTSSGLPDVL